MTTLDELEKIRQQRLTHLIWVNRLKKSLITKMDGR